MAVGLHFELLGNSGAHKRYREDTSPSVSSSGFGRQRWARRAVHIQDLPEGWSAFVASTTGQITFVHDESGYQQLAVPPGFADVVAEGSTDGDDDPEMPGLVDPSKMNPFQMAPAAAASAIPPPTFGGFNFAPRSAGFGLTAGASMTQSPAGAPFAFASSASSSFSGFPLPTHPGAAPFVFGSPNSPSTAPSPALASSVEQFEDNSSPQEDSSYSAEGPVGSLNGDDDL